MTLPPSGPSHTTRTTVSKRAAAAAASTLGGLGYALRIVGFLLTVWAICVLYMFHFMLRPWWAIAPMFVPDTSWIPRTVRFPRFPRLSRPQRPYGDITIVDQDNIAVNGGNINAPIGGSVNYNEYRPPPGPHRPGPRSGPRPMPMPRPRRRR